MFSLGQHIIRNQSLRSTIFQRTPTAINSVRCLKMKVVPHVDESCTETIEERNIRLGREMSPHLSIYKPQLTSMLSISHRITGIALSTVVSIFGIGALVMPYDFAHYYTMIEGLHLGSPILLSLKAILAFPVAYHTCNGLRHLIWDAGIFLKLKEVYSTGYIMLAATIILTAAICMM